MSSLTLHDLIIATGGVLCEASPAAVDPHTFEIHGLTTDSREACSGDVFWAMAGERRHGASFIEDAWLRGVAGVVTDDAIAEPFDGRWLVRVAGATQSLWQAAQWQRKRFSGEVLAVAGTVGKTITTEMISAVLARKFRGPDRLRGFDGALNVPLSLLAWRPDDEFGVVEIGAQCSAEVATFAELCKPSIGVITKLSTEESREGAACEDARQAFLQLLAALPADGCAIVNADDARLAAAARDISHKVRRVGRGLDCDLRATDVQFGAGHLTFRVEGTRVEMPVWGRHFLTPALCAIAAGQEMGVSLASMAEALAAFHTPRARCEVHRYRGATIIDDSQNASPAAMRAAFDLLCECEAPGRRVVVCGGVNADAEPARVHRELGQEVVTRCGADVLVAFGEHAENMVAGARDAGMPAAVAQSCDGAIEAAARLEPHLAEGNAILIKAHEPLSCLAPHLPMNGGWLIRN